MSRNLNKRLAQVERRMADIARREQLADCNCKGITFFRTAERFEEEKNLPCPGHGFRDLGRIGITVIAPTNGAPPEDNTKLLQLVATYKAARARHQADLELEEG
jgi:hypothetical protein